MLKGMTTRSPGAMLVMSAPTSSTIPMGFVPENVTRFEKGPSSSQRCRSEPDATRRDLDDGVLGSFTIGSGTYSTRTSRAVPGESLHFSSDPGSVSLRMEYRFVLVWEHLHHLALSLWT